MVGVTTIEKSRVTRTLRSMGAQAYNQRPAGWGLCVFEMAPGDSSAGLGRLKPIAELFGPVVTDESDPLFMGADGHSNNTGFQPTLPPNGPLMSPKGLHHPHHAQLAPR